MSVYVRACMCVSVHVGVLGRGVTRGMEISLAKWRSPKGGEGLLLPV